LFNEKEGVKKRAFRFAEGLLKIYVQHIQNHSLPRGCIRETFVCFFIVMGAKVKSKEANKKLFVEKIF
jgi:hypothetical protein